MGICEDAPDEYCGHVLKPEDAGVDKEADGDWHEDVRNAVCLREPEYDGLCVWHADTDKKTAEELVEARLTPEDVPWETEYVKEHLSGSILREIEFPIRFSFGGCVLVGAKFSDAELPFAEFPDAYLERAEFQRTILREAEFHNTSLYRTDFRHAHLWTAKFPEANLRRAEFPDANLRYAEFPDASLYGAEFSDARLFRAEFPDAYLKKAEFPNAYLKEAKFQNTDLPEANLTEATLQEAEFFDADLRGVTFRSACSTGTNIVHDNRNDFPGASLEEAQFEGGTDLRGANLSGARLYQTAFRDVRINNETKFGLQGGKHGEKCRYEYDPNTGVSIDNYTSRLEAAARTYRRLESLFEENAMDVRTRETYIRREEALRETHKERAKDNYPDLDLIIKSLANYVSSTLNWHLHRHGTSLIQLLAVSTVVIVSFGIVYPFIGGIEGIRYTYRIVSIFELARPEGVIDLLNGILFSAVTFVGIGSYNLYPAGVWARILVGLESLIGFLFAIIAGYVISRRATR